MQSFLSCDCLYYCHHVSLLTAMYTNQPTFWFLISHSKIIDIIDNDMYLLSGMIILPFFHCWNYNRVFQIFPDTLGTLLYTFLCFDYSYSSRCNLISFYCRCTVRMYWVRATTYVVRFSASQHTCSAVRFDNSFFFNIGTLCITWWNEENNSNLLFFYLIGSGNLYIKC